MIQTFVDVFARCIVRSEVYINQGQAVLFIHYRPPSQNRKCDGDEAARGWIHVFMDVWLGLLGEEKFE